MRAVRACDLIMHRVTDRRHARLCTCACSCGVGVKVLVALTRGMGFKSLEILDRN